MLLGTSPEVDAALSVQALVLIPAQCAHPKAQAAPALGQDLGKPIRALPSPPLQPGHLTQLSRNHTRVTKLLLNSGNSSKPQSLHV